MKKANSQCKMVNHPFFYKDGLTVLDSHLKKDGKKKLKDTLEKVNSNEDPKQGSQKKLDKVCSINHDDVKERIINQLEDESYYLFQIARIQEKIIATLEERLHQISEEHMFL